MKDLISEFTYLLMSKIWSKIWKKRKLESAKIREQKGIHVQKIRIAKEICERSNEPIKDCTLSMYDEVIKRQKGKKIYKIFGIPIIEIEEH